jgi:hypothetical protein
VRRLKLQHVRADLIELFNEVSGGAGPLELPLIDGDADHHALGIRSFSATA